MITIIYNYLESKSLSYKQVLRYFGKLLRRAISRIFVGGGGGGCVTQTLSSFIQISPL